MNISRTVWLVPISLILVALAPLPYGYYVFLRIVFCIAAAYLAWSEHQEAKSINAWIVGLVILAILYNPLVPIHLTREIWSVINLATVLFLGAHMIKRYKRSARNVAAGGREQ
jgi:hypothetical protein